MTFEPGDNVLVMTTTNEAAFAWGERYAKIERQRTDLLAACEADEAFHQHYRSCDECGEIWCEVMSALYQEAKDLRQAAIAKAKGE